MTLSISTAASTTALTKLATVKDELGLTDSLSDTWLTRQIDAYTESICGYLRVGTADDGTATLGRETLVETFRLDRTYPYRSRADYRRRELILSRWPVTSLTSVVEDGNTIDATDYEIDGATGLLLRLSSNAPTFWAVAKVVVTYTAGWLLPNDQGRTLPADIEDVCVQLVKAAYYARKRDPAVQREDTEGVDRIWYFDHPNEGMPPHLAERLDRYRSVVMR